MFKSFLIRKKGKLAKITIPVRCTLFVPLFIICCHSVSFVVTCCHSMHYSSVFLLKESILCRKEYSMFEWKINLLTSDVITKKTLKFLLGIQNDLKSFCRSDNQWTRRRNSRRWKRTWKIETKGKHMQVPYLYRFFKNKFTCLNPILFIYQVIYSLRVKSSENFIFRRNCWR